MKVVENVNGFLVPPKNSAAPAKKIICLIKNKNLRKEMKEESREMAKQYDWKIITKKYIEVYEEILDRQKFKKRWRV